MVWPLKPLKLYFSLFCQVPRDRSVKETPSYLCLSVCWHVHTSYRRQMSGMIPPRTTFDTICEAAPDPYIYLHPWSSLSICTQIVRQRTPTHFANAYVATLWHSGQARDSQTSLASALDSKCSPRWPEQCTCQVCPSCSQRGATQQHHLSNCRTWLRCSVSEICSWSAIALMYSIALQAPFSWLGLIPHNTLCLISSLKVWFIHWNTFRFSGLLAILTIQKSK